jgi:N-acetylglucosamine kinase-like BadF-type ATPase
MVQGCLIHGIVADKGRERDAVAFELLNNVVFLISALRGVLDIEVFVERGMVAVLGILFRKIFELREKLREAQEHPNLLVRRKIVSEHVVNHQNLS